jgi:nucleoside-diphosphate-sugar epimerase
VQAALRARDIETVVVGRTEGAIADLLDVAALEGVVARSRATHLLHLAWYVAHGKYWASPLNLRWVDSSVRLVEAFCQAGGEKVVGAGTCFEYARTDAAM